MKTLRLQTWFIATLRYCLPAILAVLCFGTRDGFTQDARIYYEGLYYQGPYKNLKIGETVYVHTDGDECCVRVFNPQAAVKVTRVLRNSPQPGIPSYFFFYTEKDFPEVFGTDQYEHVDLRVECVRKAQTWQDLPQPQIFVPFDFSSSNPNPGNDAYLLPYTPGHKMLVMRRAFIWENSEDIGGWHGPYGDVKIGIFNPVVLKYTDEYLVKNYKLWSSYLLRQSDLPSPIWSGYAPMLYPDPFDEWIDGPFGTVYSNIAVWDWGPNPNPDQKVAVIISEADSPNSYMGKSSFPITPDMKGEILIKVWGFGWVVLENFEVPGSGYEPPVTKNAKVFWYGLWNGRYPVRVYNPQNPAVPCESCPGAQFHPFTDAEFRKFYNNPVFSGYKVGLLGGRFPPVLFNKPGTFVAIDKDAVFGVPK